MRKYTVHLAASATEAARVAPLLPARSSLLLTDILLPGGVDGVTLARRLRQDLPELRVLIASGRSRVAGESGARFPREVPFLAKPFDVGRLANAVRAALDGAPTRLE